MENQNVNGNINGVQLLDGEKKLATADIVWHIFASILCFCMAFLSVIITFIIAASICSKGSNVFSWIARYFLDGYIFGVIFTVIFIVFGVIILVKKPKISTLTVTNKRIIGSVGIFNKRVDLPINAITSIATSELFQSVSVATSSGRIIFSFVKNRQEICEIISKLLNEKNSIEDSKTNSNLKDLTELKNLLDAGIITQEEFDKKKKQILDL